MSAALTKFTADVDRTLAVTIPHSVVPRLVCPIVAWSLPPRAVVLDLCDFSDDLPHYVTSVRVNCDRNLRPIAALANLTALHASYITLSDDAMALISSLQWLKHLSLVHCATRGYSAPSPFERLSELRDLESLRLENPHFSHGSSCVVVSEDALVCLRHCGRLASIVVSGGLQGGGADHTANMVHNVAACRTLRRVEVAFGSLSGEHIDALAALPVLQHVRLHHCHISTSALSHFMSLPPSLESLDLSQCGLDFTDEAVVEYLPRIVASLTAFALASSSLTGPALATITASAPKLTSLSFSECRAVTPPELLKATAHLKRLRSLDVSSTQCDNAVLTSFQALPNLETLNAAHCSNLDSQSIELLSCIPTLTHLNISHHCFSVEDLRPLENLKHLAWLKVEDCGDSSVELEKMSPSLFAFVRWD